MATATYTFSTGVPSITPAVYAADSNGTPTGDDLNTTPTHTDSSGVLTLTLDIGDYVAEWRWEGDTHRVSGDVASPDSLGEVAAQAAGGGASAPVSWPTNMFRLHVPYTGADAHLYALGSDGVETAIPDAGNDAEGSLGVDWLRWANQDLYLKSDRRVHILYELSNTHETEDLTIQVGIDTLIGGFQIVIAPNSTVKGYGVILGTPTAHETGYYEVDPAEPGWDGFDFTGFGAGTLANTSHLTFYVD